MSFKFFLQHNINLASIIITLILLLMVTSMTSNALHAHGHRILNTCDEDIDVLWGMSAEVVTSPSYITSLEICS